MRAPISRPSGTHLLPARCLPSDESLGYYQSSLRDCRKSVEKTRARTTGSELKETNQHVNDRKTG